MTPRESPQRGGALLMVLILLTVVLVATLFAVWGLRSETGSAGQELSGRQLLACAEQGLAFGKQYFSTTGRPSWNNFLSANVCAQLPCPPFPSTAAGSVAGYPGSPPFTDTVTIAGRTLGYRVGIYNNPENPLSPFADNDSTVMLYSVCTDPVTQQSRAVSAVLNAPPLLDDDYANQAGGGMRGQGNSNRSTN